MGWKGERPQEGGHVDGERQREACVKEGEEGRVITGGYSVN